MEAGTKLNPTVLEQALKDNLKEAIENGDEEQAKIINNWILLLPLIGPIIFTGPHLYTEEEIEQLFLKLSREYKNAYLNEKGAGHKVTAAIVAGAVLFNAVGPYIAAMM